jgi:hypothetical protein
MDKYDFSKHQYEKCEEIYGAIIVEKSYDKILLEGCDRTWRFPKGHRNDKETPVEAAIRCVKRETDVTIDEDDFILDDKSPITFKIEFPWQYSKGVLEQHVSKVIDKQRTEPNERPYWYNTKPMKKCTELYLVPIEMDRFKTRKQESDGVTPVEWVSWEDAHLRMVDSKSTHLQALHDAFKFLQSIKKVSKDTKMPELTKKHLADIKSHIANKKKLMNQPKKVLEEKEEKVEKVEKVEKFVKTIKTEKEDITIEESDTSEEEESNSEESKKKGGNEKNLLGPAIWMLMGMILVAMIVLTVYLLYTSSNKSFEEWMGLPVA